MTVQGWDRSVLRYEWRAVQAKLQREDWMEGAPGSSGKPGTAARLPPPPRLIWQVCASGQLDDWMVPSCACHLVALLGVWGPATQPKEPRNGWPPG